MTPISECIVPGAAVDIIGLSMPGTLLLVDQATHDTIMQAAERDGLRSLRMEYAERHGADITGYMTSNGLWAITRSGTVLRKFWLAAVLCEKVSKGAERYVYGAVMSLPDDDQMLDDLINSALRRKDEPPES